MAPNNFIPTYSAEPSVFARQLEDMLVYWREAELDALYGLSLAEERRARPMSERIKRRADTVIARNLSRTTMRTITMKEWLAAGAEPRNTITELLKRIARTEECWRKMLHILQAVPVLRSEARPRIASPAELPGWLLMLQQWSKPDTQIINDLNAAIAKREARADEALDHVAWTAEDDLEAIDAVLTTSRTWALDDGTAAHLAKASDAARAELTALIQLVEMARPFSTQIQSAKHFAEIAKSDGVKLH